MTGRCWLNRKPADTSYNINPEPNLIIMTLNVLGTDLVPCSHDPLTGFYRDGCCRTDSDDLGKHIICAEMTKDFLDFSAQMGNDLITPRPEMRFPGLVPGDKWCLSAERWQQALEAGVAPPVMLASTHMLAIEWVARSDLLEHAIDRPAEEARATSAEVDHDHDTAPNAKAAATAGAVADEDAEPDVQADTDLGYEPTEQNISEDLDELARDMEDMSRDLQALKRDLGRLGRELHEEFGDPDEEAEGPGLQH